MGNVEGESVLARQQLGELLESGSWQGEAQQETNV